MSALRFHTAARLRPMEGLVACGDAVVDVSRDGWHLVAVIDALGHGPDAQTSAQAALAAARASAGAPLEVVFGAVHRSLARLRGVVMSALLLEREAVSFAGVGNVELFAPEGVSRPVSMAGTLGGGAYRFRSFPVQMAPGQRWALVSDGIRAREGLSLFATLRAVAAEQAAAAMVERASRPHDDAAVLIIDVGGAA
ncbi:MAG: SpoIIE family protein phosphatase [Myxococcota bacterium]